MNGQDTPAEPMNIGIFVTSLAPGSAAQGRFQEAVLGGLRKLASGRYRFLVFSHVIPATYRDSADFGFVRIDLPGRWAEAGDFAKRLGARVGLAGLRLLGASGGRTGKALTKRLSPEPLYYAQLRRHDVRLVWNLSQHELPTWLPYIRTIWDVNHRIHSMYPEYSYSRFRFEGCDGNMANSLARASYVIVGTEEGKRQVANIFGVHDSKIRVIPFPTPALPRASGGGTDEGQIARAGSGKPYILYPARFWPHKNHVVILAALRILSERFGIDIDCVFVGADEGNLDYVMRYAQAAGVAERVEYPGSVSDETLAALYRNALALVFASAVGPDNLPPLEAMDLGCPVITADVPGAREQCGDAALFFDPFSEEELAMRIQELLSDGVLRTTLVERGRLRAARWTADDYASAVVSILDEFALIARAWEHGDSAFT